MARPIEYDKQKVLDSITKVFWLKGYEGTSVSELVTETQLNTRTMYNLFNDKAGLFQAALENYHSSYLQKIIDTVNACKSIQDIIAFITSFKDYQFLNGCLFTNTLSERNTINQESREYVNHFFSELSAALADRLKITHDNNEFSGDSKATANMIVCFIQGYSNFIKMENDQDKNSRMLREFVKLLKSEELAASC